MIERFPSVDLEERSSDTWRDLKLSEILNRKPSWTPCDIPVVIVPTITIKIDRGVEGMEDLGDECLSD